ncbi:uncharacterized protein RHIMIDRAFT_272603 [Rhizopus microsporus ATCC 52813]|uniref:Uncharacterized protein n=1 Tax=Rhizopus microsporus ATCC 52813 TaxID=1340429 RepID=A0A2G4T361_RHIZD|nr:uncharacterized protein RHIMIDRAFT_272603 [Rhizopus microsporus ATCC 52813]PHZ15448.1 hypothetical protein RHIMIDRAFT_272603 [Rhizopus microsporus ATCC 52813]
MSLASFIESLALAAFAAVVIPESHGNQPCYAYQGHPCSNCISMLMCSSHVLFLQAFGGDEINSIEAQFRLPLVRTVEGQQQNVICAIESL